MNDIKIADLNTNGIELFADSESYLRDLSEDELNVKGGGITAAVFTTGYCAIGAAVILVGGLIVSSCNGKNKPQT